MTRRFFSLRAALSFHTLHFFLLLNTDFGQDSDHIRFE
ncbi:Uncharacterised protein [Vibrio cholerae]|nr:Uncharacterised protein [Vibrio cholerae]CSC89547.1 Uncharacterised protein [Vibrio cholerae]